MLEVDDMHTIDPGVADDGGADGQLTLCNGRLDVCIRQHDFLDRDDLGAVDRRVEVGAHLHIVLDDLLCQVDERLE